MSAISALFYKRKFHFTHIGRMLREQSLFKCIFVLCFITALEAGLWMLFLSGFEFLDSFGGAGAMIISRLFSLFFLGMGIMLVISGIVTSYSTIFRSDEIPFLMVRPFEFSHIISYKFLESAGLSSWAFFFIIIPFAGSFAWHQHVSVLFALWTFLFSIPFLLLCSGVGAIIVLAVVRWLPRGRFVKICGAIIIAVICWGIWWFSKEVYNPSAALRLNISRLVPGINLAANELVPSWWISEGIVALSRKQWLRGALLWCVLLSSAMLVCMFVEWLGSRTFYTSRQKIISGRRPSKHSVRFFTQLDRLLLFLPNDIRAMIMKDIRTFFRDPMQWSQSLIFFGLLGIYFLNLRSLHYPEILPSQWLSTIAFLNVFSVSAVVCSLGSRFIYPQMSLEGQGFWILGLSPASKTKILLTKFFLALTSTMAISIVLILLSSRMLNSGLLPRVSVIALACAISFAVCGFSTGLGAIFLDLKQSNPVAIVSGFGGTLNLVLNLGFMLSAILPFAVLFHLHSLMKISMKMLSHGLLIAFAWLIIITMLATIIPLNLGIKSLLKRDF